jgi:hypothetical protein
MKYELRLQRACGLRGRSGHECMEGYSGLVCKYLTVNLYIHFVNPVTQVHTNEESC